MAETGPRRVLVTGLPATGKSTVCRLVAEGLARSTVIDADIVRESIVGGFVQPNLSWTDDFVQQIRLQREIVNAWAQRMIAAGYDVVIDDAPIPPPPGFQRDYAEVLADPRSVPIYLTASEEARRARLLNRSGRFDDELLELIGEMTEGTERLLEEGAWSDMDLIDTTDRSPEEVAALILERL